MSSSPSRLDREASLPYSADMTNGTATRTSYRCSICDRISTHPAEDDTPVCNNTDRCGLLLDEERLASSPAPAKRSLRFDLIGDGYVAGDERHYDVLHRGVCIGTVEPSWTVGRSEGSIVEGWHFGHYDGRIGFGRTRAAAVAAAFAEVAR